MGTCHMVGNLKKTCNVCFKSMRGDNLKKHMKKHERGNEEGTTLNNVKGVNYEEMEKTILSEMKEFERKIEIWKIVKTVVNNHSLNVNGLERAKKDALILMS